VLDIKAVCKLLGIGPKAVRRLARLKKIPSMRVDRRGTLRFSYAAIMRVLNGTLPPDTREEAR
jgi:excisionase family DNA binding protein